jgi:hypothetical protein
MRLQTGERNRLRARRSNERIGQGRNPVSKGARAGQSLSIEDRPPTRPVPPRLSSRRTSLA